MSKNIVQDIWDYIAFRNCTKIPAEELSPEQIRKSIGIEKDFNTGIVSYFIPDIVKATF